MWPVVGVTSPPMIFDKRTFACAVLTGQRQHFTAHERQVDAGQNRLGIGLADTADREDSVRGGRLT